MRRFIASSFLFMVVVLPNLGIAQVFFQPTPPPLVDAASAAWQMNGEPVFSDGIAYYPAGPTVFFDGNIMTRTGVYRGIPLYQDRTLEPHSIVYVPIGNNVMRPYERRRSGELAGTTGSRTPSFPPQMASLTAGDTDLPIVTAEVDRMAGTVGAGNMALAGAVTTAAGTPRSQIAPARVGLVSVMSTPSARQGVWIEFGGAKWYSAGAAVSFDPARFTPSGEYRGFPVYRAKDGGDEIYVPVVRDGALAPYRR